MQKTDRWVRAFEGKRIDFFQYNSLQPKSTSLLPVRPRPLPDEDISSWLVRLIVANGLPPRVFATEVLKLHSLGLLGVIDAVEKPEFLALLSSLTGVSTRELRICSFYDVRWNIPGVVSQGGALHFAEMSFNPVGKPDVGLRTSGSFRACLDCWREDLSPYIRKNWRQSFTTVCPKHKLVLSPCCKGCNKRFTASFAVALSRNKYFSESLCVCRGCGADARFQEPYTVDDYAYPPHWERKWIEEWAMEANPEDYVALEDIYERSFSQGWFSPLDAKKVFESPSHLKAAPWDVRLHTSLYPDIEKTRHLDEFTDFYERQVSKWIQRELHKVMVSQPNRPEIGAYSSKNQPSIIV